MKAQDPRSTPGELRQLKSMVAMYSRVDRRTARAKRREVIGRLGDFSQELETKAGRVGKRSWPQYFEKHKALSWYQINEINAALLARWFMSLIRSSAPNSVEARLNDILQIQRQVPNRLIFQLDEQVILEMFSGLTVSSSTRARMADSLRSLYRFVQATLEIPVPEMAWWKLRAGQPIHETCLLTQPDFEKILGYAYARKSSGNTAAAALLIGYYFGLRATEICNLRIGDLWLDGTPTVFVWHSKRGHSRSVEGVQVPRLVIHFLQEFRHKRLRTENGNYSSPLLKSGNARKLTRHALLAAMSQALEALQIEGLKKEAGSVVHLLRHACANRWWALGCPLIDITHKLGHRSADTTVRNYLHVAPFLQKDQLQMHQSPAMEFSNTGLAGLLGITVSRLAQYQETMISRPDKKAGEFTLDFAKGRLAQLLGLD